jgi:NAD(P)H-hydrate repair Nnr-like enzyme with NAD(P)H-hydrate epimerase domain
MITAMRLLFTPSIGFVCSANQKFDVIIDCAEGAEYSVHMFKFKPFNSLVTNISEMWIVKIDVDVISEIIEP